MRIVGHLDMDAFFAAVEERDKPRLKGKPIVVGADPLDGRGRGVVSTANYKAREYGIHSAMPISEAWRLAKQAEKAGKPATVFIGGNFGKYNEVSQGISAVIRKYVPLVEEASIDEFYLDLSFSGSFEEAAKICKAIKKEIKEKESLSASVGIGPNKLIAKIASDVKKPDGLTVVVEKEVGKFLEPLPIRRIPGIGPKTEAELLREGVKTVKDLRRFSREELKERFGKWGIEIYDKIYGIDQSPVTEEYEVKSIGEQETFLKDAKDPSFISGRLQELCENVFERFKDSTFREFKTVTLIVRFADFETKTRSRTLAEAATDLKTLSFEAMRLLLPFLDRRENPKKKSIRLIGVRIEKLN